MSSLALREHIWLFDELRQIVTAMRNFAYAELQRLERAMAAQSQAQACVLQAMADVLGEAPDIPQQRKIHLVIGSERGFCGGFNDSLVSLVRRVHADDNGTVLVVAGNRLADRVAADTPSAVTVPGSGMVEECTATADMWLTTVQALVHPSILLDAVNLQVTHHDASQLRSTLVLPKPDLPTRTTGSRPLQSLASAKLSTGLLHECLRVMLLGACYASLWQENKWRLMQMQRAEDHLDDAVTRLRRQYFVARQMDITTELETLMSSLDSGMPTSGRS